MPRSERDAYRQLLRSMSARSGDVDDGVVEFRYSGQSHIPDDVTRVIVDPSVTSIPRGAFEDHQAISEVVLPEGLVKVNARAFRRCTALQHVNLPSTLEEIDLHAFTKTAIEKITIPASLVRYKYAFVLCQKLTEVVFAEGCRIVDEDAFDNCHGLEHIRFPSTIQSLGENAFTGCWSLTGVTLPDSVLTIGSDCWQQCNLKKFRVPPLVTTFDASTMRGNSGILSLELHGNIECMGVAENNRLSGLAIRNVAIPNGCTVEEATLRDICDIHDDEEDGLSALLSERFDGLDIHKLCYYQSYSTTHEALSNLRRAISPYQWLGRKDKTGSEKDCLGMTPLHILACSLVQRIEIYRLLVQHYPESLIMKDMWGDIPLTYALYGGAPVQVNDFLLDSYKTLHPDFVIDWGGAVKTFARLGNCEAIESLLDIHRNHFIQQSFDLAQLVRDIAIDEAETNVFGQSRLLTPNEEFIFIMKASVLPRYKTLGNRRWLEQLDDMLDSLPINNPRMRVPCFERVLCTVQSFENAKEGLLLLELALWKLKISETSKGNRKALRKRTRFSGVDRERSRVNCGANVVLPNVVQFI